MLAQRIITASLLGPVFFGAIWWGSEFSNEMLMVILSVLFWYEYYRMFGLPGGFHTLIYILIGILPWLIGLFLGHPLQFLSWAFCYIFLGLFHLLIRFTMVENPFDVLALGFAGHMYIGLFLFSALSISILEGGKRPIIFLLLTVFSGDIFAYFGGKYLGRHKLCPAISPKKTVEGAIFGLVASMVAGPLWAHYVMKDMDMVSAILLSALIGVVAQFGDILESIMKRTSGIKDSGALLPGHGGFLDRFDGVILATPVLYLALQVF